MSSTPRKELNVLVDQINKLLAELGSSASEHNNTFARLLSSKHRPGHDGVTNKTVAIYQELFSKLQALKAGMPEASGTETPTPARPYSPDKDRPKPKSPSPPDTTGRPAARTTVPATITPKKKPDPASDVDPADAASLEEAMDDLAGKSKGKAGFKGRTSNIRKMSLGKGLKFGLLAGLGAALAGGITRKPVHEIPQSTENARRQLERDRAQKITRLLEQARMERMIQENQARIAQNDPRLYTSILAGRSVPTNSVVLGGRPRMDLMQELAASMGSGRFDRPDPLSELIG